MVYTYMIALVYIFVIIHTAYMIGAILVHCAYIGIGVHRHVIDGGRRRKGGR
jgi:hypothetical protein